MSTKIARARQLGTETITGRMADLKVEGNDVVVRLNAAEALVTWRRQVRVPVACLRMVQVEQCPLSGLSLLRLPGFCVPGVVILGSGRRGGRREFAAVRAGCAAVVMDAEGASWDRVVISHTGAVAIAAELAAVLLGRGPGKPGGRGAFPASLD
jgi:hypothetical protein